LRVGAEGEEALRGTRRPLRGWEDESEWFFEPSGEEGRRVDLGRAVVVEERDGDLLVEVVGVEGSDEGLGSVGWGTKRG